MTENSLVSIIIPTKNSEATIRKRLESIRNQTYPNIEIILVDNYSGDNTREIAQKYGARIYLKDPERASQVDLVAKKAKGKYVYEVGSDFILETSLVKEAVTMCEEQGYDAVAVHNTSDPTVSFWSKVRKLERDCYRDDELNIGARFLKKSVFESIDGFDESLIAAEDYDLHNRLLRAGYKIGRIRAQEVHIGEPKSLREIVKKHYYYRKTIGKYIKKNPEKARKQFNPIRPSYLRHWNEILKHPRLSMGFVIYQFVRYSASAIGFIIACIHDSTHVFGMLFHEGVRVWCRWTRDF